MKVIVVRDDVKMRINFLFWEYPPQIVGGLGTYVDYITHESVQLSHDLTVFTFNPGNLKTREILKGVEVHRPLIADASYVFPLFVMEYLRN